MKKITRIAALLAAGALLFGAVGCSDDDDSSSSDVAVTGVSISPTDVSVAKGGTQQFKATVTPEKATNKTVTWEISEGGEFAEVEDNNDGTATVTGKARGDVKLTVKTEDGGRTADVTFNVYDPYNLVSVTGVSLDKTEATVKVGGTETLKATVSPEDADNRNVTWSSSDDGVATVANGVVTGVAAGPATITVKTEDGGYEATCEVTVEEAEGPGGGKEPGAPATTATYSFTGGTNGIVAADLDGWDLATKDVIGSPSNSALETLELDNGATIAWKGSSAGTLRFRATHDANSGDIATLAPTITALNYNGGQKEDNFANGVTVSALDRYVSIPVDGAGKITASVKFVKSDGKTGNLQAVLVDSDGELLGDVVEKDVTAGGEATIEGTTTGATTVILAFSRNKAGGGGLDVTEIKVTPAAE